MNSKVLSTFLGFWLVLIFINLNLYSCKGPDKPSDPTDGPVVTQPEPPSQEPVPTHPPDPVTPPPVEPDPGPDPDPEPTIPDPEPIPDEPVPPIPLDPLKTFKTNVTFFGSSATAARKTKYQRAICVTKKVVADSEFKSKILAYNYNGTRTFHDTTKTPAEILEHIGRGNETLQPAIDNELDVEIEFYYAATSTVGYTYASSKRVWVNTKFFDTYTPSSVAANLVHEWLHKLGYKHAVNYSASRDHSVPYAIGSMVRSIGKKYESSCN